MLQSLAEHRANELKRSIAETRFWRLRHFASLREPGGVGISKRPRLICQRHLNGSEYANSIIFLIPSAGWFTKQIQFPPGIAVIYLFTGYFYLPFLIIEG